MKNFNRIKGAIFGQLIGDAIGVPVEMKTRNYLKNNPITEMTGYGSHKEIPKGWWSDDGSLTLALVESLLIGRDLNINDIADKIVAWYDKGAYTPHEFSFGSGGTTRQAISRYKQTGDPLSGGKENYNNGNGSLMRILPLVFYLNKFNPDIEYRYRDVKSVSSVTHAHPISILACLYLIEFAGIITDGFNKFEAYKECRINFIADVNRTSDLDLTDENNFSIDLDYIEPFKRLLYGNIYELPEENINSGFYVVQTLEAAIWCIMTTNDFKSAVLKAVNLGGDSDSTAAVTGGLAGLIYGYNDIPRQWLHTLPRKGYLFKIINSFAFKYQMEELDWL